MILLTKDLQIYDEATFGMNTWGNPYHQCSLEKSRKNWYIHDWKSHKQCGTDYGEERCKIKLDVIKEFETYEEAIICLNRIIKEVNDCKENWEEFVRSVRE